MDKKDRPYTIQKYDPAWVHSFEEEKRIIQQVFGILIRIDHVGSTAVPGMWAKPQIDIMAVVDNLDSVDQFVEKMKVAGYGFDKNFIPHYCKHFYKDSSSGERLVTIQIFQKDNQEVSKKLCFRDYLRAHPEEVSFYSQAKLQAYNNGKSNRVEYSKNKNGSLLKLLARAEKWCGENKTETLPDTASTY